MKRYPLENRYARVILEKNVLKIYSSANIRERFLCRVGIVLGRHRHDFADAVKSCQGFGDLRTDLQRRVER